MPTAKIQIQKIEFDAGNTITARIFGRTAKGEKICLYKKIKDYVLFDITHVENLPSFKQKHEMFEAEINDQKAQILKVYTRNFEETQRLLETCTLPAYEHDLPFEKKFLLETKLAFTKTYEVEYYEKDLDQNVDIAGDLTSINEIKEEVIDLQTLYFDIETFDDGAGINYHKNPILMISVLSKTVNTILVARKYQTQTAETFDSEKAMLQRFKEIIEKSRPDIISGFNIKGFDIPYIIARCKIHNITFDVGAKNKSFEELKTKGKWDLDGVTIFDIFDLSKNIMRHAITDGGFSLNNVSKTVLQKEKVDVNIRELCLTWDTISDSDLDTFVYYCKIDTELCENLHTYFMADILEFQNMLRVSLDELTQLSFSQIVENYLITNAREYLQLIPNRPDKEEITSRQNRRIQGAFVFDPIPGIYRNVAVFDFTSLYPTIIESHNITKGTIQMNAENAIQVPEREYHVRQTPKAFIPSIIGHIVTKRIEIKKLLKEKKDRHLTSKLMTLKIIANSLYGYLAFYMSRWYSFEAAEAVTSFGRYHIKTVVDTFTKEGFKVMYGDTDSIFVELELKTIAEANALVNTINSKLPGLMSLEMEDVFETGMFVGIRGTNRGAKKKYALRKKDGTYKIAGMEMVRGDWSPIAREIQEKVIHMTLSHNQPEDIITYIKKEVSTLHERKKEDFTFTTKLKKPVEEYESEGPHVVVAKQMITKGQNVRRGTTIKYIINEGKTKRIGDRAKTPEDTIAIDFDYYIENQILPVVDGIFDVFGIEIADKIAPKNQSSLDSFF
jgi:DNA polymerase I